jgi:hypothetical protein
MSYIRTYTGRKFFVDNIESNELYPEDIAGALAHTNRYNGHTIYPYSVAQHSVLMYRYLVTQNEPLWMCKQALLHDAAEAYLNDIPGPWKHLLPDYQALEERLSIHIFKYFNVLYPLDPMVKALDKDICLEEMAYLTLWPEGEYQGITERIEPWDRAYAEDAYLGTFKQIM